MDNSPGGRHTRGAGSWTEAKTMAEHIAGRLREATVRPTVGSGERQRWDALMKRGTTTCPSGAWSGGGCDTSRSWTGTGWRSSAGTPGRSSSRRAMMWIGWLPEQQFRRLHLIANDTRFVILPGWAVANLASRVSGMSVRRVSCDMRAAHGHPVAACRDVRGSKPVRGHVLPGVELAGARAHAGVCPPAPEGRRRGWRTASPRRCWSIRVARDAREQLRALDDGAGWRSEGDPRPWTASRLRSLWECLGTVEEFRGARGRRYPLATILAIAVAAKLAGYHGVTAFAEFAQGTDPTPASRPSRLLQPSPGAPSPPPRRPPSSKSSPPSTPTPSTGAARAWAAQHASREEPVAIDGKHCRAGPRD